MSRADKHHQPARHIFTPSPACRHQEHDAWLATIRVSSPYTVKKENQIFLIYKEIQNGAVAKSYMTSGLLICGEIFAHFLIYWEALTHI
jgi:hypothetical protein